MAAWQAEDQKLKELDVKFTHVLISFSHVLIKEEEEKLLDDKLLELESQKESKVAAWQAEDQKLKELDVKFTHVLISFSHVLIKEEEEKLLDDKLLELESQKESKVAAWQAEDQKLKELDVKFKDIKYTKTCVKRSLKNRQNKDLDNKR